jgi:hypothetical protein
MLMRSPSNDERSPSYAVEHEQINPSVAVRTARGDASRPRRQPFLLERGKRAKITPVRKSSGESRLNRLALRAAALVPTLSASVIWAEELV